MSKTYEVEVWKTYIAYTTVTVEASSEDEAEKKAVEKAEFSAGSLHGDDEGVVSVKELQEEAV